MRRITNKDLDELVDRINAATGSPMKPWDTSGKTLMANIGNYYIINGPFGGVQLARMTNKLGAISEVSTNGYGTKRELRSWMIAFLAGIDNAGKV